MEIARKVAAALVGILVIIVLVLLARWTGDQIRTRFFKPKPPVVQMIPGEETEAPATPEASSGTLPTNTASVSAVPATGPADFLYPIIALIFASGFFTLKLSSRLA